MPKKTGAMETNAELADYYNETRDLSEFDEGEEIPISAKRSVTISVRFSDNEIAALRERADAAGEGDLVHPRSRARGHQPCRPCRAERVGEGPGAACPPRRRVGGEVLLSEESSVVPIRDHRESVFVTRLHSRARPVCRRG